MIKEISLNEIALQPLTRISPSGYTALSKCPLRVLLSKQFDKPVLLLSPNAYYGTVLHKLFEEIIKKVISIDGFEKRFKELKHGQESKMVKDGYVNPSLQVLCKNFALKKLRLKDRLEYKPIRINKESTFFYETEKWVSSKDGRVGGRIDLIKKKHNLIEIIDFKTGEITENNLIEVNSSEEKIKEEYVNQIHLYSYLYYLNEGIYPTSMKLVDLQNEEFKVESNNETSKIIFESALRLIKVVNEDLEDIEKLANPSLSNCKNCLYKPSCKAFVDNSDLHLSCAIGKILKVEKLKNNTSLIYLDDSKSTIISGIKSFQDFSLTNYYGFFNLFKASDGENYLKAFKNYQIFKYS